MLERECATDDLQEKSRANSQAIAASLLMLPYLTLSAILNDKDL